MAYYDALIAKWATLTGATPGQMVGGSASPLIGPMFVSYYAGKLSGPTITALAQGAVVPWWQGSVANGGGGLNGPVGPNDLIAAG